MKIKYALITGLLLTSGLMNSVAFAQLTSTATGTNTNTSGSTSNNQGNALTNNFYSPGNTTEDMHDHVSGVTGANTAVGLGSFASSFSSDYCGGTAQAGLSVPYVTLAAGKPVLGEAGTPCVDIRAAVHTMEFSATYGNAAHAVMALAEEKNKRLLADEAAITGQKSSADAVAAANDVADARNDYAAALAKAQAFADTSAKLATAAVNMLCSVSDDVRKAYNDAGIDCKGTQQASNK